MDESKLIRLFSDLTGESEGAARNVVMYLEMLETDYFRRTDAANTGPDDAVSEKGAVKPSDRTSSLDSL